MGKLFSRWVFLSVVLGWLMLASHAQAFVLIEIAPATFPRGEAGVVITYITAQEKVDYSFWLLMPRREPPRIPLPIMVTAYEITTPPGSTVWKKQIAGVQAKKQRELGEVSQWQGQWWGARVQGGGTTRALIRMRSADLHTLQNLAVESLWVFAAASSGPSIHVVDYEIPVRDILAAPEATLPPLPTPSPPKPSLPSGVRPQI